MAPNRNISKFALTIVQLFKHSPSHLFSFGSSIKASTASLLWIILSASANTVDKDLLSICVGSSKDLSSLKTASHLFCFRSSSKKILICSAFNLSSDLLRFAPRAEPTSTCPSLQQQSGAKCNNTVEQNNSVKQNAHSSEKQNAHSGEKQNATTQW